ncbi:virion structural protein [Lactococcus phage 949]|uniref:Putative phage structural protein n=1 Tax=Lactococcus phage 949 TaxID=881953 RepID=E0YJ23_9CAUD|nr:virion structural protein [Lactococcus phage 949]ADM73694.1 putative phage structural protein [Lactococcus phage 949]
MSKFGIKEVADVIFFDIATGKPVLFFDTLKTSSIENASETTDATGGRGNAKLMTWNYSRTATLQMQDALLSLESMAVLAGTEVVAGTTLYKREKLAVKTNTATLSETPSESTKVTIVDKDGKEVSAARVSGTSVTGLDGQTTVSAYYEYKAPSSAKTVKFVSDKFPGAYRVIGDTIVRDNATGKDRVAQFMIPKAQLQAGFTFTMDAENVSTFDFNLDILRDGESTDLYSITIV